MKATMLRSLFITSCIKILLSIGMDYCTIDFLRYYLMKTYACSSQKETPWSDGVPGLSQKPIEPGQSYIYRFKAWPPGQYWYHSHSRATLLDGLYGPLLIRRKSGSPNPFSLISKDPKDIDAMETAANNPVIIMPSDWDYYNSSQYKEADANSRLQLFCVDSILINGKGSLFCPPHEWLKERQIPFMKASWPNDDITGIY